MKNETYRLEKNVQYNHSICTIYISLDNIFKIHCLGEKVKFIPQQSDEETASSSIIPTSQALNQQPQGRSRNINRYNLKFHVETKEEIEARKEQARLPVKKEPDTELEQGTEFCYIPGLEFPKRPKWEYDVSPQLLDMKENKYFRLYVDQIEKSYPVSELSYFELNLETWRQLWRVLEMSDIVLVVVDARFPVHNEIAFNVFRRLPNKCSHGTESAFSSVTLHLCH